MIRGGAAVVCVSDVARAVRFYVETLGMKLVEERPDGSSVIDAGDGLHLALHAGDARATGTQPAVVLFSKVPIEEAISIYENRGISFDVERSADVVVARFRDPDGNLLAVVQGS